MTCFPTPRPSLPARRGAAGALALAATLLGSSPSLTQERPSGAAADRPFAWVTLGTQGGPAPSLNRSEPANLLLRPGEAILIDAGDGAATRLIGAGARFPWLRAVFISHLHFDHTGGLFALLGLRNQERVTTPLTIYGPVGTRRMVEGLFAAMTPGSQGGYGVPGAPVVAPDTHVTVVELGDGSVVDVDGARVTAAKNTHYSWPDGSEMDGRFQSLSYRFDLKDRSIAYTGDTGPSDKVRKLATGADLLVSEMVDADLARARFAERGREMGEPALRMMIEHLTTQHLTPEQVGRMAQAAGVKKVVLTHLAGGGSPDPGAPARYAREVQQAFKGPVVVANDMDRF